MNKKHIFHPAPTLLAGEAKKVAGGHMGYHHLLVTSSDAQMAFAKVHDPNAFTDEVREHHSRLYLQKENALFNHLRQYGFQHIPTYHELIDDHTLIMEALPQEKGWQWRAPKDEFDQYVSDNLAAIKKLESLHISEGSEHVQPTLQSLRQEGWEALDPEKLEQVRRKLAEWRPRFHMHTRPWSQQLAECLSSLRTEALRLEKPVALTLAHHDLRQSNVAWHPEHGVRLVDWSWAGAGREKSDRTTLLIDLWKSGHDVTPYLAEHFNPDHALELIGFWLAHSLWPAHHDADTVRFQQVASAVSAYHLRELFLKHQS